MNILENRKDKGNEILKNRFIGKVLRQTADDLNRATFKKMKERGFKTNDFYSGRAFSVSGVELKYEHFAKHRFVDMRTRITDGVRKKKKSHPIHNRIVWGHYNNVIRELAYGFTEEIKNELSKLNSNG
jgi:hypothetical protein